MAGVLMREAVVEDYPISSRLRGKCKLTVERAKNGSFRTVKTTTSRQGMWYSPKKSKYTTSAICVIQDSVGEKLGWLRIGPFGITIQWANGAGAIETLASPPHWCKPRRTPESYKLITRDPFTDEALRTEKIVQPADPPELCDAYDAWEAGIRDLIPIVKRVWEVKHEVTSTR